MLELPWRLFGWGKKKKASRLASLYYKERSVSLFNLATLSGFLQFFAGEDGNLYAAVLLTAGGS